MLQVTVLGSGLSPGQTIDARARARNGRPGRVPKQHVAQPLSLESHSPSVPTSTTNQSPSYNSYGPGPSSRNDHGDEILTWAGNEVTWSRGAELVRRFTFNDGFRKDEVVCATFAWFDNTASETDLGAPVPSTSSSRPSSPPPFAGPAFAATTVPSTTFGPFHTSQNAVWAQGSTRPTILQTRGRRRRAVVIVLPDQAHIYFASGEDVRVHIPFRLAAVWPLPTGGIIVQRSLELRESRANSGRPRPSAADRTTMSVLDDVDRGPPAPLPMLYTLTDQHGELKVVFEGSLAGGIRDPHPTIVPGTLTSQISISQTILYVAPDPYPFIVVYDRGEGKIVFFRRVVAPLDKDDAPPALPHKVLLQPEDLLRTTTAATTASRRGRVSMPRVPSGSRQSLAGGPDSLDRARRKSRLSTTSFVADDEFGFDVGPFAMEPGPRGKRMSAIPGGAAVPERVVADTRRLSTSSNRRLSAVAEKRVEWEFPKSSLGMLNEDLRETTMMAGLSHNVQRSEIVLDRIWEWQSPGSINLATARVFMSENRSNDYVHLNLVLSTDRQPTTLYTFRVQVTTSPVEKYTFEELRATECLAAAPVISTRSDVLDTLVVFDDSRARLITSGRSLPIDIPRTPTVDGRDEVARKLASSLSMTLENNDKDAPGGIVDLIDECGSRVTVVYRDGERVRVSLDFTLPTGLAKRALEALAYALPQSDYEELAESFLIALQDRPIAQRLDPGVHWRVLSHVLYTKCGIPHPPALDARGDMLSAWSTQSDPILRRLSRHVKPAAPAQLVHNPISPAPSAPRVLLALHLVAQDCRLACMTEAELSLVAPVIFSLASAVGRTDWVDYWRRIMPSALSRSVISSPAGEVDTSILDTWDEPPDVLVFLERAMVYNTQPFPSPSMLAEYPRQPSPLGHPRPCAQTEILSDVYRLMRPTANERATPRTVSVEKRMVAVVRYMVQHRLSRHWLADLPFGVGAPVLEMMRACNTNPPKGVSEEFYTFIGRTDLAANCQLDTSTLDLPVGKDQQLEEVPTVGQLLDTTTTREHSHPVALPHVRFGTDKRLEEIERIMQTTRQRTMTIDPPKGASEADVLKYNEQVVATIAQRTLAITVGQGMFVYGSRTTPTEVWIPPRIDLGVKVLPSNTVSRPPLPEHSEWPVFHSGVSSALEFSPECKGITASWIAYNRPSPLTPDHAGFLLGLGLQGHLRVLDSPSVYKYLDPRHDMTTIGMTLGLGASFAGSQDLTITKILSLHTTALLPLGSMPLNQSAVVQSVALVAIGLVYVGSRNLRMAEIALKEISRNAMPGTDSFNDHHEAYSLSSAMAFGLIMLGRGGTETSEVERRMVQQLTLCIHGVAPDVGSEFSRRKAEPKIDSTVTSPGAMLALGLMFLKTGRKDIADILSIPQTPLELESVRPEHLLVRTLARSLIMWDEIEGTPAWFDAQLPPFIRSQHHDHKRTSHMELISEVAYFNIMAGACLALSFRYASSANESIHNLLTSIFGLFGKAAAGQSMTYEGRIRRNAARQALNIVSLAAAIEMSGTGELGLTRRLRMSHGQEGASINYGSHMAMHMALGVLYLGRGYYTLGNSNLAIAALAISCFPRFLPGLGDNKAYPQAFRHLWTLAVEPRCLIARDVDTRESIFLPVKLLSRNASHANNLISPTLIAPMDTLKSIVIDSPRYLPVTLDFDDPRDLHTLVQTRTIWVKRRAGYIDYAADPRGYRSLMVRAGTMSGFDLHYDLVSPAAPLTVPPADVIELVTTHSTNPMCIAIARNFAGDAWLETFARNVLFECLSTDKLLVLGTYLSMALGLLSSDADSPDELLLQRMAQTRFAHRFYRPQVWDKYFAMTGTQKRHPIVRQTFLAAMVRKLGALASPPPSRFEYFAGRAIVGDVDLSAWIVRNNVPPSNLLKLLQEAVQANESDDIHQLEISCRLVSERYMDTLGKQYGEPGGEWPLWKRESIRDALSVWRGAV